MYRIIDVDIYYDADNINLLLNSDRSQPLSDLSQYIPTTRMLSRFSS